MVVRVVVLSACLSSLWACDSGPAPGKAPGQAPGSPAAGAGPAQAPSRIEGGGSAAMDKEVVDGVIQPPPDFDPLQECDSPLDPELIPPVPVRGVFARDQAQALDLPMMIKSGRLEIRADQVILSLDTDELDHCSPFLKSGDLPTGPRMAIRLGSLEKKKYRFPDLAEDEASKAFWYWNYVYTTEKDMPMTVNAFTTEDSGDLIIEEIDEQAGTVAGRLLLCKGKGNKGWAVGRFEVPLCDKRPKSFENDLLADPNRPAVDPLEGVAPQGEPPPDPNKAP